MRRVGQVRKRDANEAPIVDALKRMGVRVQKVSEKGFVDLVCFHPSKGVRLLEVKADKGTLTPAQVETRRDGWPVCIVRNTADALALFGIVQ
jgi:hypothetical protein